MTHLSRRAAIIAVGARAVATGVYARTSRLMHGAVAAIRMGAYGEMLKESALFTHCSVYRA